MVLLDAAIMMNPNTWVASGHVGSFSDPLMECKECHTRHRADKLIEEREQRAKELFIDISNILITTELVNVTNDSNGITVIQTWAEKNKLD